MSYLTQPTFSSFVNPLKSKLQHLHVQELKHTRSVINVESKWNKMLQQYRLTHLHQVEDCEIQKGTAFFREFLRGDYLQKIHVDVNIPLTLIMDDDENLFMLHRDKNRLCKKRVTLEQYQSEVKKENIQMLERRDRDKKFLIKKQNVNQKSQSEIKKDNNEISESTQSQNKFYKIRQALTQSEFPKGSQKILEIMERQKGRSKNKMASTFDKFKRQNQQTPERSKMGFYKKYQEPTFTTKNSKTDIEIPKTKPYQSQTSKSWNFMDFRKNSHVPYVIFRKNAADKAEIFQKQIINFKNFDEIKFTPRHQYIYQRFILSRNMKAMIVRLCYHTQNDGSYQRDFAYRYQNNNYLYKSKNSQGIYETGLPLCTISPTETQQYSFEVSKIVGSYLIPYQHMAKSLVNYLERVKPVRINKVYLDFIVDVNQQIWLTNLKHIQLGQATVLSSLNKNQSNITCTIYCKLCGTIHRRDEVTKTLTFKLLYELVEHFKKRTKQNQRKEFQFLTSMKFNQKMNIPCQLCDICYKLVVSEHQLIQVEKQMAKTINIKVNDDVAIETVSAKNRKRPAHITDGLRQWRLMIYFSELDNHKYPKESQSNLYIQYRINGSNNLSGCCKIETLGERVALNFIKIHYFFSEHLNIENLINDRELVIRLTNGTDWNKYIAQGSSGSVSHFKNNLEAGQRHSSTILIFDNSQHYSQLRLTMGLVCDGIYDTTELNLYRYQKDIFLPDISYHNCNPLPKEWIEMFSPEYALKMMDLEENSDAGFNFGLISRTTQHEHLKTFFRKKPNRVECD